MILQEEHTDLATPARAIRACVYRPFHRQLGEGDLPVEATGAGLGETRH